MSKEIIIEADTSISVIEGIIFYNGCSPPSLQKPSRPSPWASNGKEPSSHFPIRPDVSIITDIEIIPSLSERNEKDGPGERDRKIFMIEK
jgi:hypothetical protein